ncbi:hypothetical protein L228DRAFT_259454 [Xylona heveae TC161]|uniref:Uncharacterized protein n=1 Tax=Xylona heveae (strain CBS 132557 / TC161) TaxID=1328760 RepID=A0A165I102_XYLHT|nr:hypothetical protein L228DRAFT_259454 [Xylona heveae TC161]KZF24203.1 hypothetical protein L228DRAFT_259454 [Xylona heveae TC161]
MPKKRATAKKVRKMKKVSQNAGGKPRGETLLTQHVTFSDLPPEIHENIIDHVFGHRGSMSRSHSAAETRCDWRGIMRNPGWIQHSQLALVSHVWRQLVQQRIYRNIRVRGTFDQITYFREWFKKRPHLKPYVRHIEIWMPVWSEIMPNIMFDTPEKAQEIQSMSLLDLLNHAVQAARLRNPDARSTPIYSSFARSPGTCNVPLEGIFQSILDTLPEVRILTIEAGQYKKSPMLQYFLRNKRSGTLPVLPSIEILVIKDAWNLMHCNHDYKVLAASLPNVKEIQASYADIATHNYRSMTKIVPEMISTLTHLTLDLEPVHCEAVPCSEVIDKLLPHVHLCPVLGKLAPQLKTLNYAGCICPQFFKQAQEAVINQSSQCYLRSIDFTARNFCHTRAARVAIPGPLHLGYVQGFESTIAACIRSLPELRLEYFRMRFISIGNKFRFLDPYFELSENKCKGLWNYGLKDLLKEHRPEASYVAKTEGLETAKEPLKEGVPLSRANYPTERPLAIHTGIYLDLAIHNINFPSN